MSDKQQLCRPKFYEARQLENTTSTLLRFVIQFLYRTTLIMNVFFDVTLIWAISTVGTSQLVTAVFSDELNGCDELTVFRTDQTTL